MVFAHVSVPSSNLRSVLHSVKQTQPFPSIPKSDAVNPSETRNPGPLPASQVTKKLTSTANRPSSFHSARESVSSSSSSSPSSSHPPSRTSSPPSPWASPGSKMHQTSSRLLRMTEEDRPYTRVSGFSYLFEGVLKFRLWASS